MPYGSGPFGTSAFGGAVEELPDQVVGELPSSDKIDFVTMRYVQDADTGERVGMDDVAQRVILLTCFEIGPMPEFIDQNTDVVLTRRVRDALSPLTTSKPPVIRIEGATLTSTRAGSRDIAVTYTKLASGTRQTAVARLG